MFDYLFNLQREIINSRYFWAFILVTVVALMAEGWWSAFRRVPAAKNTRHRENVWVRVELKNGRGVLVDCDAWLFFAMKYYSEGVGVRVFVNDVEQFPPPDPLKF